MYPEMRTLEMGEWINTADHTQPTKAPDFQRISFFCNWNKKLDCTSYTTFRMHNPAKYKPGGKFGVYLNNKHHHDAEVLSVKVMSLYELQPPMMHEGRTIPAVNEWIAQIDTGYDLAEFQAIVEKMYKGKYIDLSKQKWNLVLFRKLKV